VRVEHDSLGERSVPDEALYGIQTMRALENFALGGDRLCDRPALVVALARVKAAAALANRELGRLEPDLADAIVRAAREVAGGAHHEHFPLPIVQGGGGTSTNMNANEVLANRANELLGSARGRYAPVHPNDHVNRSQSTNDVIPTAEALAVHAHAGAAGEGLVQVRAALLRQAAENEGLEHLGRTCLQDAVPLPVSAVHQAQARTIDDAATALGGAAGRLLAVPLGATAVGTGLGAPEGFGRAAVEHLRAESGVDVRLAEDPFAALASLEPFAAVAEAAARCGRALARIATDLRLLASGPVGGIGEVRLPVLQPGSSIMPGKVNPVLPELVVQVSFELEGSAQTVRLAAAAGELELAIMGPVVTAELLRGLDRLVRVAALFAERCLAGLEWQRDRVDANLQGSLQPAVERAQVEGYEEAFRQETDA
jgi:aspartate ammonia-lyase